MAIWDFGTTTTGDATTPVIPPMPGPGESYSTTTTTARDPYDTRIGNGALPAGISGAANRAYTREVQPNELAGYHMNQLTAENSPYIQQARMQAMAQANARGLGNSSYAMGNAQGAAINAAMPLAQQQAGAYGTAAGQNVQYLNQYLSDAARAAAAHAQSSGQQMSAAAHDQMMLQMQRENLAYEGEQAALGRSYGQNQGYVQHGYGLENQAVQQGYGLQNQYVQHSYGQEDRAQQQDYNTQNLYNAGALNDYYGSRQDSRNTYNNILQQGYGSMFQNPDAWNDPQGAMGMVNMFGNYAGNMIDQYNGGFNNQGPPPAYGYGHP